MKRVRDRDRGTCTERDRDREGDREGEWEGEEERNTQKDGTPD